MSDNSTENHLTETNDDNILILSPIALNYLNQTRKWNAFFAIIGFIGVGALILLALFINTFMAKLSTLPNAAQLPFNPGPLFSVVYMVVAVIYFFPAYFLYQGAKKMKKALSLKDSHSLDQAFSQQNAFWKFIGIFTIIFLGIYLLVAITGLFVGLLAS